LADFVEKLRKRIAAEIRPKDILSENGCSMPSQCGCGGHLLLERQLPCSPNSFFDFQALGPANFGSSPETEFFNTQSTQSGYPQG
jgi:hypothetical protein